MINAVKLIALCVIYFIVSIISADLWVKYVHIDDQITNVQWCLVSGWALYEAVDSILRKIGLLD